MKSFPSILALVLLTTGVGVTIFAINGSKTWRGRASNNETLEKLKVTSITDTAFSISWHTRLETTGSVRVTSADGFEVTKNDVRDEAYPLKYQTHLVVITGLKPATDYSWEVAVDGAKINSAGQATSQKTAGTKTAADNDIAQGRVIDTQGQPISGAIVYLTLPNAVTQSAMTDTDGHWMIPLATTRNENLNELAAYDRIAQIENIAVLTRDGAITNASVATANDNPVPDIVVGQNNDFLKQTGPTPTAYIYSSRSATQGPQPTTANNLNVINLEIVYPSEKETVTVGLPEFIGRGPKSKQIEILVESDQEITDSVTVDSTGEWRWTPTTQLTPGEHKVTVSYTDDSGQKRVESKSFTVVKTANAASDNYYGGLPSFTATQSAQPTQSIPTIAPTTALITVTPVNQPTITIMPTIEPTVTPNPTTYPKSGNELPTGIFLLGGVVVMGLGIMLLLH